MNEAMKPCPFCGSDKRLDLCGGGRAWYVACRRCYTYGPSGHSEEEAADAWNHRAPEHIKRKHSTRKIICGIIATIGFFAMIGFCAADALTYAERMAYSVAGLAGFLVGAGVAGAFGRGEDKQG